MCLLTEPGGRARDAASSGLQKPAGLRPRRSSRPPQQGNPAARSPPQPVEGARSRRVAAESARRLGPRFLPPLARSLGPGDQDGPRGWDSIPVTLSASPHSAKAGLGSLGGPSAPAPPVSGPPPTPPARKQPRRPAAAARALAAMVSPPRAADRARGAAVLPDQGATAVQGLQAKRCWRPSRARRGAGPPETNRAEMLASLSRRPKHGHCCLVSCRSTCSLLQGWAAGPRQAASWISEVRGRVCLGFGPVERPSPTPHPTLGTTALPSDTERRHGLKLYWNWLKTQYTFPRKAYFLRETVKGIK